MPILSLEEQEALLTSAKKGFQKKSRQPFWTCKTCGTINMPDTHICECMGEPNDPPKLASPSEQDLLDLKCSTCNQCRAFLLVIAAILALVYWYK